MEKLRQVQESGTDGSGHFSKENTPQTALVNKIKMLKFFGLSVQPGLLNS